jgi:hypothetical protein
MQLAPLGALALVVAACADPPPHLLALDAIDHCLVPGDYGAIGAVVGTQSVVGLGNPALTVVLDPGPPKDDFFLRLVAGAGVFAAGLRTGSFAIGGADADAARCGLCTNVIADIVAGQGPTKFYFATAGTVVLTSTSPIAGSAQALQLVEVTADGGVVAGGCTTAIGSIAFGT